MREYLAVLGMLAILSGCTGLDIVDDEEESSSVDLTLMKQSVVLSSDERYLFVSVGSLGVEVVDISTPSVPKEVLRYKVDDVTYDLASRNGMLYLANGSEGVEVVDITTPSSPRRLAYISTGDDNATSVDLSVDGTTVAIGTAQGALLYTDKGANIYGYLGSYDSNGTIRDIRFDPNSLKLYLANFSYGLEAVDITTPSDMQLIDGISMEGSACDIEVSQGIVYLSSLTSALKEIDFDENEELEVKTVYDPHDGGQTWDMTPGVNFRYLYLAKAERGLEIVDNSDPRTPHHISYYDTNGTARGVAVNSAETLAFIADGKEGLKVIDIADKNHPRRIGYLKF